MGLKMSREITPFKDFKGNNIFNGDTIQHPDGTKGKVFYKEGAEYPWKVDYGDEVLTLSLQIGDKGRAVVVNPSKHNFNNHHAMLTEYCKKHDLPLPLVVEPKGFKKICFLSDESVFILVFDRFCAHNKRMFQSGIWSAEHAQVMQDHFYGVG